jgi:hypothetical protein
MRRRPWPCSGRSAGWFRSPSQLRNLLVLVHERREARLQCLISPESRETPDTAFMSRTPPLPALAGSSRAISTNRGPTGSHSVDQTIRCLQCLSAAPDRSTAEVRTAIARLRAEHNLRGWKDPHRAPHSLVANRIVRRRRLVSTASEPAEHQKGGPRRGMGTAPTTLLLIELNPGRRVPA